VGAVRAPSELVVGAVRAPDAWVESEGLSMATMESARVNQLGLRARERIRCFEAPKPLD
jgi:hypothetical protein